MIKSKIWFMEGLSSQKDIIQGIKAFTQNHKIDITIFASHRHERNEILSVADYSFLEPDDAEKRLQFIIETVQQYGIDHIHTGRNCYWFEENRGAIEASGATLTTGAGGTDWLSLADEKVSFAQFMEQHCLPVVPSLRVSTPAELQAYLATPPFHDTPLCVKPVTGIYGMGFWRFDDNAAPMDVFNHPEKRIVHPQQYLAAVSASEEFPPLILMPYLPGPEYSVDVLADKGDVLAAVGRRKEGAIQHLVNAGEAVALACACARTMKADGLVNVQTRNDKNGTPLLLETNMRPSGGIGYTLHSGVNLPGLFAAFKLGLMTKHDVIRNAKLSFNPVAVRSMTDVVVYPENLSNRLN